MPQAGTATDSTAAQSTASGSSAASSIGSDATAASQTASPRMPVADIIERIHLAGELLGGLDLAAAGASDLARIISELRRLESRCAGLGIAIAGMAKKLGEDPDATLLGRGQVSGRRSRRESERAKLADDMPDLADALRNGDVSGEHLDAVARTRKGLSEEERSLFDELGPELAEDAKKQPVDTFAKKLRKAVDDQRADHGLTRLQKQRQRSFLKMWDDADGMGHLDINADLERFAKLRAAIEARTARLAAAAKASGESVTLGPALQLDALIELIEGAQGGLGRPTITVLVDHETLVTGPHDHSVCETSAGVPLPITVVHRYTCDGLVQVVTLGDTGLPLDVGRKHRTATPAQWAALRAMYATCVWRGCDRPITWTQAHHIDHWEHGGSTDLDNLVPLCSRHHHMVHDDGWRLVPRPDRTLEIHRPAEQGPTGHAPRPDQPPPRIGPATLWATTKPDRQPARPTSRTSGTTCPNV